jgi:hypothetical protein
MGADKRDKKKLRKEHDRDGVADGGQQSETGHKQQHIHPVVRLRRLVLRDDADQSATKTKQTIRRDAP